MTGLPPSDLTDDPITVLERRQRDIADRFASRSIHERRLTTELADVRTELEQLATAAKATAALLAINTAIRNRTTTPVPEKPARPTRKRATT